MSKLKVGNYVELISENPRMGYGETKIGDIGKIIKINTTGIFNKRFNLTDVSHVTINFTSQKGWQGFDDEVKLIKKLPDELTEEDFEGEPFDMSSILHSLDEIKEIGKMSSSEFSTKTKTKKERTLENLRLMGTENPYIFNRTKEIELLEKTLIQYKKPNAILVGKAGVGKTAIVEKLAYNLKEGNCCDLLKDYEIYEFTCNKALAGTKYRGDFEEKIQQMLSYVEGKKIILFIDEIHNIMNLGGAEGAVSMDETIKPYLARGQIKVIGATTEKEYKEISKDSAFERRFRKVSVVEPTLLETIEILENSKRPLVLHYNIDIKERNIRKLVFASKSIKGANPDKSFTLLELALSNAKYNKRNEISDEDISYAIENF